MDSRRKSFALSSPILRAILTFLFENGKAYPNVITQDKFLISHFLFRDHYFTGVSWSPKSDRVAVNWMNRGQNVSIVSECKDPIWICTEVRKLTPHHFPSLPNDFSFPQKFREDVPSNGWSTLFSPVLYSRDGASFLVRSPIRGGAEGHFQQISLVQSSPRSKAEVASFQASEHTITSGIVEVNKILAWDETSQAV